MVDIYIDDRLLARVKPSQDEIGDERKFRTYFEVKDLLKAQHVNLFDIKGNRRKLDAITRVYFDSHRRNLSISANSELPNMETILNPFSIFLLEESNNRIDNLNRTYGYFFSNYSRLGNAIKLLFTHEVLTVSKYADGDFSLNGWNDLTEYTLPTSNVVIVDRYLLINKEDYKKNRKYLNSSISNLINILKAIISNETVSPIKVTILCSALDNNQPEEQMKEIEYSITRNLGNVDPQVQILAYDVENMAKDVEKWKYNELKKYFHDRYILTNFFEYYSGNALNYFDYYNNPQKDTRLNVGAIGKQSVYESMMSKFKYTKEILDNFQYFAKIGEECGNKLISSWENE